MLNSCCLMKVSAEHQEVECPYVIATKKGKLRWISKNSRKAHIINDNIQSKDEIHKVAVPS